MKICVELNGEMQKQWDKAKKSLEKDFNRQNNTAVSFNNSEILAGILYGWREAESAMVQVFYAWTFSEEDVARMKQRNAHNS